MPDIFTGEALAALATLTVLEIILGIDNIVFISIVAQKLPAKQRQRARQLGLLGALASASTCQVAIASVGFVW